MLGIFMKKGLVIALDECQSKLKAQGFCLELTNSQYSLLTRLPLFNDIESRFELQGLSNFGGLCLCLSQVIDKAIVNFESTKVVNEIDIDFTIKLATLALLIGHSIPQLTLTNNDKDAIDRATQVALVWAELTTMYDEMLIA